MLAKSNRNRNWLFEVYPESVASNWRDVLDDLHIQWVESPVHQFDVNPTGETKKAHIHVLLQFESLKSYDQVYDMIKDLNGTIPIQCHSPKGSTRYFAHLDNPEKFQYNVAEIIGHGGADVADLLKPSASVRYSLIAEMMDYIDAYNIKEFKHFLVYCREYHRDDWFPLLCDNSTMIIKEYIKSNRYCDG